MDSTMERLPGKALELVCTFLFNDRKFKTLASLASTCEAFHEHALDTLWHTLPSPGYSILVYTLPRDAWTKMGQKPGPQLSIVRPLVVTDLVRLKHYSHRVKRIEGHGRGLGHSDFSYSRTSGCYDPDPSVLSDFVQILSEFPGGILLPNVCAIDLDSPGEIMDQLVSGSYYHLHIIYGPQLLRFHWHHLFAELPPDAHDVIVENLARSCPDLQDIEIRAPCPPRHRLSNQIVNLCHLVSIYTTGLIIGPEALFHFATLNSLETLRICLGIQNDDALLANFGDVEGKGYFPRLMKLELEHDSNLAVPSAILCAVSSPALQTVSIMIHRSEVTSQAITDVIIAIADRRCTCLQFVTIHAKLVDDNMVTFDTIRPLLSHSALRGVFVRVRGRYVIDDNALNDIAAAWPLIRQLILGPDTKSSKPRATLWGLAALARGCRHLRMLSIAFDTNLDRVSPIRWDLRPGLGVEQRKLCGLAVGKSKIDNPIAAAAFLSGVFPALRVIDSGDLGRSRHSRRWIDLVCVYMPQFVKVREQERKWAKKRGLKHVRPLELKGTV